MKTNKLLLTILSSLIISCSCPDDDLNDSGLEVNSICGNLIVETGEECDSDFYECVQCIYPRMIFINSSDPLTSLEIGNRSLEELDELCKKQAIENNLYTVNNWKAWISKNDHDIKDRVYNSPGLYINYNRDILAYSFTDLTDGSINNPVLFDQNGKQYFSEIWTGTLSDGTCSEANCNNWTLNEGLFGTVGDPNTIMKNWTSGNMFADCSDSKYFYCIESENAISADEDLDTTTGNG